MLLCLVVEGVANGTSKNVGLGKFWQDLEISEAFLISLKVSFFHGLLLLFLSLETFSPKSLGLGFLTRISASRRVSDFTIRHPWLAKPKAVEELPIFIFRPPPSNSLLLTSN